MNKLEIEIPDDKEIDWEASAKQKQIVFKDKQLTYEDICYKLFVKRHYYADSEGDIHFVKGINASPNNASTKHQLECILAKNKLANVARYLNGDWASFFTDKHYIIWMHPGTRSLHIEQANLSSEYSTIIFKSKELAQQAIEILGEEVVKLALESLY
jgi:hypothetical protein